MNIQKKKRRTSHHNNARSNGHGHGHAHAHGLYHKSASLQPQHAMARLFHFSDLLNAVSADCYLVLDLDETVYIGLYAPCAMIKEKGLARYQHLLSSSPRYKHIRFDEKTKMTRMLQAAVSSKRAMESDTVQTIRTLQQRGVQLFALTARFSSMAATTQRELSTLGLDFSLTSPFPSGRILRDEMTDAIYEDGVVYTNATEKGPVLNRFLHSLWSSKLHQSVNVSSIPAAAPTLSQSSSYESLSSVVSPGNTPPQTTPQMPSAAPPGGSVVVEDAVSAAAQNAFVTAPPSVVVSNDSHQNHLTIPAMSLPPAQYQQIHSSGVAPRSSIIFKTSKKLRTKKMKAQWDESMANDNGTQNESSHHHHRTRTQYAYNRQRVFPERLVFVDDRLQNCVSVMNGVRVGISILTYHYTPQLSGDRTYSSVTASGASTDMNDSDDIMNDEAMEDALADLQIHTFITTQHILNDQQAKLILQQNSHQQQHTNECHPIVNDENTSKLLTSTA